MSLQSMMRDSVTLVKKDGTIFREGIKAQVGSGKIITFEADLPLEPGDHFLRTLPSNLVEDYEVIDPNFISGIGGIPSSFQAKVRRTQQAPAPSQQVVQSITTHFHGANSRLTIGTDNSTNTVTEIEPLAVASFLEQLKPNLAALPEPQRSQIAGPLQVLEAEIVSGAPDQSKLRQGLSSAKAIAEGAAGNLVAAGIGGMIARILGG